MSPLHEQLALLIASGKSVAAAARELELSESGAWKIIGTEEFQRHVADLRAQIVRNAVDQMAAMFAKALEKLDRLIESESPAVSHAAIRTLLTTFPSLNDHADLAARVAKLEAEKK